MSDIAAKDPPDNRQLFFDLFDLGFKIMPCRGKDEPGGKIKSPLLPPGWQAFEVEREMIEGWLARWPDCVPGIRCGPMGDGNWSLAVIDLDNHQPPKPNGLAEFGKARGDPLTWSSHIVRTAGGGLHLYYKMPTVNAVRLGNRRPLPGCDSRIIAASYVIAPGAVMADGTFYEVLGPAGWSFDDLTAMPEGIYDLLDPPPVDDLEPDLEPDAQIGGNLHGGKIPEDKKGQKGAKTSPVGFSSKATVLPFKGSWTPSSGQLSHFDRLCSTPAVKGQRSEKFCDAVWFGKRCGIKVEEIIDTMLAYPQGVSAKYRPPSERKIRVPEEVRRVWDSPDAPAFGSFKPTVNLGLGAGAAKSSTGGGGESFVRAGVPHETAEPEKPAVNTDDLELSLVDLHGQPATELWFLENLFPLHTPTLIVGRGGVGKSTSATYMAIDAAHGDQPGRLRNPYHLAVPGAATDDQHRAVLHFGNRLKLRCSSLIVTGEDGKARFGRMVRRIDKWFDGEVDPVSGRSVKVLCLPDHFDFDLQIMERHPRKHDSYVRTDEWMRFEDRLAARKERDPSFGLLILDSAIVLSGIDLSLNMAAKDVLKTLNKLCGRLKINVVILGHTTKSGSGTKATTADQERAEIMGSATLVNQCRGAVVLRRAGPEDAKEIADKINRLHPEGVGEARFGPGAIGLVRPRDILVARNAKDNDNGDMRQHPIVLEPGSGIPHDISWARTKRMVQDDMDEGEGEPPRKTKAAERRADELVAAILAAVGKAEALGADGKPASQPMNKSRPFGKGTNDRRAELLAKAFWKEPYPALESALKLLLDQGKVALVDGLADGRGVVPQVYTLNLPVNLPD